jgi:hypothetical protein
MTAAVSSSNCYRTKTNVHASLPHCNADITTRAFRMQVDFGGVKRQNLIFWNKMKLKSNRNRNETNVTGVFFKASICIYVGNWRCRNVSWPKPETKEMRWLG